MSQRFSLSMVLLRSYEPQASKSSMAHAGNLENAREIYTSGRNGNLNYLLSRRFSWMNQFISKGENGLEIGAGIAASKDFINCKEFLTTNFANSAWLDRQNIDALDTGFESESFDFVIVSNVIHHLAFPERFLRECQRILRPSGRVIIQEIYSSLLTRIILKAMKHEGFNESVNVFDPFVPTNNPQDAWSANCSIPKLLFEDKELFGRKIPAWRVLHFKRVECLLFLNSGGVVAKTRYLPLSSRVLKVLECFDSILVKIAPKLLALQVQVVLQKSC